MNFGPFIENIIDTYGYAGLFMGMLLENVFPPIPSEIVLGFGGFFVGMGKLNLWGASIAATAGVMFSAILFYAIGRYGGIPLVMKFGKRFKIREDDLNYTEKWFHKYGGLVIIGGRFLPIIRTLISFPAGLAKMNFLSFFMFTLIPSFLWSVGFIWGGSILGENWEQIGSWMQNVEIIAIAIFGLGALLYAYSKREVILKKFFPMKDQSIDVDNSSK